MRTMSKLTVLWTLFILYPGASPATGQRFAIKTLRVTDGHPIREVRDGLLVRQSFEVGCDLTVDWSEPIERPLAGTAGSSLTLELALSSCPPQQPIPPTSCTWRVEEAPATPMSTLLGVSLSPGLAGLADPTARIAVENGLATFDVRLPETTGIYLLELDCRVEATTPVDVFPVKRVLFVTYASPLELVSDEYPPTIDAYRRACFWGRGFATDSREADVLKALMGGLYQHGQLYWRYGSFDTVGRTHGTDNYRPRCGGHWCSCPWEALVEEKTSCNFANCTQFSEVFEKIATVLGIGVFEPVVIEGSKDLGFATWPEVAALDPRFDGNVLCEGPQCPDYLFSNHVMRKRDGVYYDPTFNQTYSDEAAPIFKNVEASTKAAKTLKARGKAADSERAVCIRDRGYGYWLRYSAPVPLEAFCTPPEEVLEAARGFSSRARFSKVDADRDGLAEALAVDVKVKVEADGEHILDAVLTDGRTPIAHAPSWGHPEGTYAVLEGRRTHKVRLLFSGEEIYRSGYAGRLTLSARFYSREGYRDSFEATSSKEFRSDEFGENDFSDDESGAREERMELTAADLDTSGGTLRIPVDLSLREAGTFEVLSRLSKDGRTITYSHQVVELPKGDSEVVIGFSGTAIAASGLDAPYELSFLARPAANDGSEPFFDRRRVSGVRAADFAGP